MYGIADILGGALSSAGTPAIGAAVSDSISKADWLKHLLDGVPGAQAISDISGGTLGALAGAATGAGIGALTGGKAGAAGGALQGLTGGAWGAYKADDIGRALNFSGQENTTSDQGPVQPHADLGAYFDAAGKGMMPAFMLGAGVTGNKEDAAWYDQNQKEKQFKNYVQEQQERQRANSYLRGYAEGGQVDHDGSVIASDDSNGVPVSVYFPPWVADEFAHTGGLDAMQRHFAIGGALSMGGPVPPDMDDPIFEGEHYPQSRLTQSTRGAGSEDNDPISYPESYAHGGLLTGDGDGMSDSIPASIEGNEPIRVADGEYAVPKDKAEPLRDKLEAMLTAVRSAAHAKKGKQIVEGAAQRAFIRSMSGVHA